MHITACDFLLETAIGSIINVMVSKDNKISCSVLFPQHQQLVSELFS